MHADPQGSLQGSLDVEAWKKWTPQAQAKALGLLQQSENSTWRPFYCKNQTCDGNHHIKPRGGQGCIEGRLHEWDQIGSIWTCVRDFCGAQGDPVDEWVWRHARQDQRPPKWSDDWLVLNFASGRGSGKTRSGSEITHRVTEITPRIGLLAATGPDIRETMVEGVSGILATAPPDKRPLWEPSKRRLTWPNGCIAQAFSAEEPDRLRGPQTGFFWLDEPAHYAQIEDVWDNMLFGLRVKSKGGHAPKVVTTSTPKPTKWVRKLEADPYTVTRRVSTYANLDNLTKTYQRVVIDRYEGTRQGRQELYGEVLEDVEGALWNWNMFKWFHEVPELRRIVVAVDPAGSANAKSDETGIIVVGIGVDGNFYVLEDLTGRYSPEGWASKAHAAYEKWSADCIIAEKNYGGDMVRRTLESSGHSGARIKLVDSRRGKALRAEPVVALYEKDKVRHLRPQDATTSSLAQLEDEQTTWVPGEGASPNRVDALVHGITELSRGSSPASISNPLDILGRRFR